MKQRTDNNTQKPSNWFAPRFTRQDILKGAEYDEVSYLKNINDSMELDSAGEDLAWLRNTILTRNGKKISVDISLCVQGDVRVIFKGDEYRNASSMPEELIRCYHNFEDPTMLDHDYDVINNNWFEIFIGITLSDGTCHQDSVVCDEGYAPDLKEIFADMIAETLNDDQEFLSYHFKEGDIVRWNDPDKSLADQMTPEELKEYREREFTICKKREEDVYLDGADGDLQVLYSELMLQGQQEENNK